MLLFVYDRSREIFGDTQEISLWLKKQTQASAYNQQSFYVNVKMIDSFFVIPVQTIESKQHKTVQQK